MFGTLKGRILMLAVIIIAAAGFLYANNGVTRGLDLQGGRQPKRG